MKKKLSDEELTKDLAVSKEMCAKVFRALDDKQGENIKVLDIHEVSILADYFVIANGKNPNHVNAMIDEVQDKLAEGGYDDPRIEGYGDGTWVLMDYGRVIVHVFQKEARQFYDLERIWGDSTVISPDELKA